MKAYVLCTYPLLSSTFHQPPRGVMRAVCPAIGPYRHPSAPCWFHHRRIGGMILVEKNIHKKVAICRFVYYLMDSGCWNLWWNSPIFSYLSCWTSYRQNRPVARVFFTSQFLRQRPADPAVLCWRKKCNSPLVFQGKQQEQTYAMSRIYRWIYHYIYHIYILWYHTVFIFIFIHISWPT